LRVGDMVEKWSRFDQCYLPGWVVAEIDGRNITVRRPGLPGCCAVSIELLRPNEQ
jgi:hypothetical protein